ncbi:Methyltransf-25 domain-containing protein [Favolaschia claudopus]|uniref:Methyltransf-25 domain-containing protein n=1 Tax=Favolaschia claudopus TaxID=2862362 RepID=A0AAW0CH72_9AGAR
MEEISGFLAKSMLVQGGLLPTPPKNVKVLDNACGGGVVASVFFTSVEKPIDASMFCGDVNESMVASTAERIKKNGWNAEATIADAQALPFPDNHFTHTLINLGIQMIPDAALAIRESFRVLQPGGTFGMTTSSSPGWLESFEIAVDGWTTPPTFASGPVATKESIENLLMAAGFTQVNVQTVKFQHTDSMTHFLAYIREMFKGILVGSVGEKYEKYMRERYGDGNFALNWEAFVTTAQKP